jgi:hypothetical protein
MSPLTERDPDGAPDEGGFVLVWFALMLTVLMGMAAFSVDVGNWYHVRSREQKAADAAALAAAVHWPGDKATGTSEAIAIAGRNGFPAGEVTVNDLGGARVEVKITRDVKNFFGNFLGVDTTRISRRAVGEYQATIPLGSPANTYGDEPVQNGENRWSNFYTTASGQPQFWGNIFGPRSIKSNGDAHQAKVCGVAMLCNAPDNNLDYFTNGYTYIARVGAQPSGTNKFAIEVFDPAFVNVGDTCTDANLTNGAPHSAQDPGGNPPRYASGSSSTYCSGDQLFSGSGQDGNPPTTTFMLRAPDNTPWDYLDNPLIMSGSCNSDDRQFAGYNGSIASLLSTNPLESYVTKSNPAGAAAHFKDHFRKWFRICEIPSGSVVPGDYVIQIRTNLALGNPATTPVALDAGSGANRFSVRAAWLSSTDAPNATDVSIFASNSMSLYANDVAANTQFFLARVLPGSAGRTLRLKFFDTGDASQPGDIQVLPPATAPLDKGGTFSGCTVERPRGVAGGPVATAGGCKVTRLFSGTDNGKWNDVFVPIPSDYTCDEGSNFGCWLKLKFTYPAGTVVNDTTTWEASLDGAPVRLVE